MQNSSPNLPPYQYSSHQPPAFQAQSHPQSHLLSKKKSRALKKIEENVLPIIHHQVDGPNTQKKFKAENINQNGYPFNPQEITYENYEAFLKREANLINQLNLQQTMYHHLYKKYYELEKKLLEFQEMYKKEQERSKYLEHMHWQKMLYLQYQQAYTSQLEEFVQEIVPVRPNPHPTHQMEH